MSEQAGTDQKKSSSGISRESMAGAPWLIISKFILFFFYFAISILVVRSLGANDYGIYSICRSLVEYGLVFIGLGLNAALIRFIPELCVNHNKAGMYRLVLKSALLQILACAGFVGVLVLVRPQIDEWWGAELGALIPICGLLLFSLAAKDFLNDTQTALFRSKQVAIFSLIQGILWLVLTAAAVIYAPGIEELLLAQCVSIFIVCVFAGFKLRVHLRGLNWRSPAHGIGQARVLRLALPTWGNHLARALMLKYTEVFLLGIFAGTAAAGAYDLGYSVPLLVITFIPMAVQTLMAASMNEAYSRNPECLPELISGMYKMLILLAMPLSAFGVFFAARGIVLIYGEEMRTAGPIAVSFCVFHLFPLISTPLSMAIQAKEKVHKMFPLMILQVVVNLILDFLLIPPFGIPGALVAVFLTFFLTIPLRLYAVKRLVGGIYFPAWFMWRMLLPCLALAGLGKLLFAEPSLPVLFGLAVIYLICVVGGIRGSWLIHKDDKTLFLSLASGRSEKWLALLLGMQSKEKEAKLL